MSEYSNENTGVGFVNEKRQKPTQAAFKGNFKLMSEDATHWLDCWGRVDETGKQYLDVRLTEMLPEGSDYADAEKVNMKLFAETKTNDKAPDFKGEVELPNGDVMDVACWKRATGVGKPLLSFKMTEPYEGGDGSSYVNKDAEVDLFGDMMTPAEEPVPAENFDNFDDDIPF